MKTITAIFATMLAASSFGQLVSYDWSIQQATSGRDYAFETKLDGSGNLYTIGSYEGIGDFDPSSDTVELSNAGSLDVFISKYDQSGSLVWAKSIGSAGWDSGYSIYVNDAGDVFATGAFRAVGDFDPSSSTFNLTSNGNFDVFVLKLTTNGEFEWAKSFGGTGTDLGLSIFGDASGNLYSTGCFESTVDFDPGTGMSQVTSNGDRDAFISKLDENGNFIWAKTFGSTEKDQGRSIHVDEIGNVYVAGEFRQTVDFDPSNGVDNIASNGDSDAFVSKLDANGGYLWTKRFGGTGEDICFGMFLDEQANIYSTGWFEDVVDFDPGTSTNNLVSNGDNDIYLSKLDSDGNYIWTNSYGSVGNDKGTDVYVDEMGYIYATGQFSDTVDFDLSSSIEELNSYGEEDAFVLLLDENGDFVWSGNIGSSQSELGRTVIVDNNGVYVCGEFRDLCNFDPNTEAEQVLSLGNTDGFLVRLDKEALGINESISLNSDISLYPNPTSGVVTIDLSSLTDFNNFHVSVIDATGKLITSTSDIENGVLEISLADMQNGVYFLRIENENEFVMKRIIKQ